MREVSDAARAFARGEKVPPRFLPAIQDYWGQGYLWPHLPTEFRLTLVNELVKTYPLHVDI